MAISQPALWQSGLSRSFLHTLWWPCLMGNMKKKKKPTFPNSIPLFVNETSPVVTLYQFNIWWKGLKERKIMFHRNKQDVDGCLVATGQAANACLDQSMFPLASPRGLWLWPHLNWTGTLTYQFDLLAATKLTLTPHSCSCRHDPRWPVSPVWFCPFTLLLTWLSVPPANSFKLVLWHFFMKHASPVLNDLANYHPGMIYI